jgi:hypothetical protein
VLGHQQDYRASILKTLIDNEPAAIYLLRGYLRICTPFSIEMSINNTISVYHRAGPEGLINTPLLNRVPLTAQTRAVGVALRQSIPPQGPRGPLPGTGKNPRLVQNEPTMTGLTDTEKAIPQSVGRAIQVNLCIMSPTADFNAARDAIQQAKEGIRYSNPNAFTNVFRTAEDRIMSAAEAQIFAAANLPRCVSRPLEDGYRTPFEKFGFPDEASLQTLQQILKACDGTLAISGKFDAATRKAITAAKAKISQQRRIGLTDLSGNNAITLRANSFHAIELTCT